MSENQRTSPEQEQNNQNPSEAIEHTQALPAAGVPSSGDTAANAGTSDSQATQEFAPTEQVPAQTSPSSQETQAAPTEQLPFAYQPFPPQGEPVAGHYVFIPSGAMPVQAPQPTSKFGKRSWSSRVLAGVGAGALLVGGLAGAGIASATHHKDSTRPSSEHWNPRNGNMQGNSGTENNGNGGWSSGNGDNEGWGSENGNSSIPGNRRNMPQPPSQVVPDNRSTEGTAPGENDTEEQESGSENSSGK